MLVKKIKLQNFKSITQNVYDFGNVNLIEGKNGSGKSTIRDAIIFCFYNRTSDGSSANSSDYITDGQKKCSVEIVFEKDGIEYTVRRERTLNQTRITFLDGSQSEDDSVITQRDLESILPDFDYFQNVFNIRYFMTLPDKEKRDFILSLTPKINREEVFEKLGGKDIQIAKDGYKIDLEDIRKTHKAILSDLKFYNTEADRLTSIIDFSKPVEISEFNPETLNNKKQEYKKLSEIELKFLENQRLWNTYENDKNAQTKVIQENDKIEKEMAEIKIADVRKPTQIKLNNLVTKRKSLRTYKLPENKCPTCYQIIAEEHKNKVEEYNKKVDGWMKALDAQIDLEKMKFNKSQEEYLANEKKKQKLQLLKAKLRPIPKKTDPPNEKLESNRGLIKNLEEEISQLKEEKRIHDYQENEENKRKQQLEDMTKQRATLIKNINDLDKLKEIFSPKGIPAEEMRIKMDPILEKFKSFLPDARIETLELYKNGMDFKEVFKIIANDIEYSKMSLGEKTRIDIALSQIIDLLSSHPISMFFLDNAEVLDSDPNLKPQAFIARVIPDKELTISIK